MRMTKETPAPWSLAATESGAELSKTNFSQVNDTTNGQALKPDIQEAEKFLTLLDEGAERFTFQVFPDNESSTAYARHETGTLDDLASWLTAMNQAGAGVFVTVNETDGQGRSKRNIQRIRAIWQEDDDGDAPALPLEPHIIVMSSPGKYHRYLLTDGAPLDEFEPVQRRLVDEYGSDPDAKDRARVMRLPGFYHQKNPDHPHMVCTVHESGGQPYDWESVKQAFPPVDMTQRNQAPEPGSVETSELERIVSFIPNDDLHYADWLKVGMALHHETGGDENGFGVWLDWSAQSSKFDDSEMRSKWRSFGQHDTVVTIGSLIWMARQNGYTKDRTEAEIIADAGALTEDSDSDTIAALITEARQLPPVAKRRVHNAVKKATGLPLSAIREQESANQESSGEPDHLELANRVKNAIGPHNIIGEEAFTWTYRPERGIWRPLEPRAERQCVQRTLESSPDGIERFTKSLIDGVTDLFKSEVYQPDHQWNQGEADAVSVPNGLLELDGETWTLREHRREDYRTVQVPVPYDPSADAPRFSQFLAEVFQADPDAYEKSVAILEMMGYTLQAHCRHEKFVILVGEGSNGKSVLLSVLEALLGSENVSGVQPAQFDRSFQRAHLHLKLANIVTELRQGEVIADSELKGITSGEPANVEHKFRPPFVLRPYATCWFGTNHLPHTRDFSYALFRRALVVPFNNRFPEGGPNCDPNLKGKLFEELPGILNMALASYRDALVTGKFTEPDSCAQAKHDWRMEADQAAQFINDACHNGGEVGSSALFDAYRWWAHREGIKKTLSHRAFSERVCKLNYEKGRSSTGTAVFKGLSLATSASDYQAESCGF